jgi:hypothetical protein
MVLLKLIKPWRLLILVLCSAGGGAYLYHRYRDAEWEQRYAEYQRQLQSKLTESEQQLEALNTQLGVARSQLVTQADLEQKYQTLLTSRDSDFEKFRREHSLALQSISDSLLELRQQGRRGTEKAQEVTPPPRPPAQGDPPAARPAISYAYADGDGRVHLTDPNIWVQGDESLALEQHFRVEGTVLKQTDGSLMTERIRLLEVSPTEAGQYRELAEARLVDAHFTYANAPVEGPPSVSWGPSWLATLGTSFRSERPLRFGASARVVQHGALGLAGGLSSDFQSLEGSGGDVFLTFTPSVLGRELGLSLGGGVHLPVAGSRRVRPNLTLNFVVY